MGCKTNKIVEIEEGEKFRKFMDFLRENVDLEEITKWTEIDLHNKKLDLLSPVRPGILRGLECSVRPADERPFLLTY